MRLPSVEYTGQAGFLVKNKSQKVFAIDLYLSNCVERLEGHIGFKRLMPQLYRPDKLKIDVYVATHAHWDHYDYDTIPLLVEKNNLKMFAAYYCKKYMREQRILGKDIKFVKPGDCYEEAGFRLHFIKCDHGKGSPKAVGLILEFDEKRIYFTGDTSLRLDWVEEIQQYGDIDIMIAPINGAYGNLNEKECVQLAKVLTPQLVIPTHYGMFASHGGSPLTFMEEMKKYSNLDYILMTQGERITLG